jgi:hypothetical protein
MVGDFISIADNDAPKCSQVFHESFNGAVALWVVRGSEALLDLEYDGDCCK